MDRELAAAVAARYHAVNGHHPMTAEDDAYASEWFVPVEELAAVTSHGVDEIRRLQLANRLPLPSYIRRDGTQMVARDLLELADEAGGFDELPAWFARQWASPLDAVREWDAYLSGLYVCLRSWRPENMRRKDQLVELISNQLERPEPDNDEWLAELHRFVEELDALEPPFAPYDRLRFGGPVSRDRLITAPRRRYPLPSGVADEPRKAAR
ncbi:MAG: hypothetical protein E6G25_04525 [Actinobacteria bacterium]|nr:MAG: hypothetical protein E6G25_04525 [Actinomycetota bacterium]